MVQQNIIIQEKLAEFFESKEKSDLDIFNQLALYIYAVESRKSDLHILAKILPEEYLVKLINYYDGDVLKLPSKDEYWKCYLTALSFFLKQIKGYSWTEIKELLDLPEKDKKMISSISLGYSINRISLEMTNELKSILKQVKGVDYKELLESIKNKATKFDGEEND